MDDLLVSTSTLPPWLVALIVVPSVLICCTCCACCLWPNIPDKHVLRKSPKFMTMQASFKVVLCNMRLYWRLANSGFLYMSREIITKATLRHARKYIKDPSKSDLETREINPSNCPWSLFIVYPKSMENQEARKTLIYYHGGGFIFGEERTLAVMVAKQLGVQVISVKYRLSPEHPFPVPIEDCVNATRYIFENENQLKIGKFGVYGESAGGHLALSVTMKVDYMALCGRLPEVVSAIVPMGQCLYMDTPSFLDKRLQQENTGSDIARMCWLGFAGLDVHDRKLNRVMAENRHLSSETRQSLSARLPRDCLRGKRGGFKKPTKVRPEVYIEIEEDPVVAAFQSRLQVLLEHGEYVFSPGTTSDENMMNLLKNTKKLVVSCASMDILRDDGLLIYHRLKNLVEKQRLSSTDLELVVYENVGHLFMYTNKYVSNRVGYSGYTPAADKLLQTLKF